MPSLCLHITVVLSIFTICEQRKNSISSNLENVMDQIISQSNPKNVVNRLRYERGFNNQEKENKRSHVKSYIRAPYFLNKLNNARYQTQLEYDLENDLDQALRFESDRICKANCGRTSRNYHTKSYRNGDEPLNEFSKVEYISDFLHNLQKARSQNELQNELENESICRTTGRCECAGGRCGQHRTSDKSSEVFKNLENFPSTLDRSIKNTNQRQLKGDFLQGLDLDRICRAIGRCECTGRRCGQPYRAEDETNEIKSRIDDLDVENFNNENQMLDRICKATGQCRCAGGRCGLDRISDKSTDDFIQPENSPTFLDKLNEEVNQRKLKGDFLQGLELNSLCRSTGRCECTGGRCGTHIEAEDKTAEIESSVDLKNENLRNKNHMIETIIEQALRTEVDRICKATGRCGHCGGWCGKHVAIVRTVNEVEKILDKLNKDLSNDQNKASHTDANTQDFNEIVPIPDQSQLKYNIFKQMFGDREQDHEDRSEETTDDEDDFLDQTLKRIGKIYKINDDLEVVLQDEPGPKRFQNSDNNYSSLSRILDDDVPVLRRKQHSRARKRILPLTWHQKQRKYHKVSKKFIPKLVWRRNMPEQPKYGVPFELQVQGLGQFD